MTNEIKWSFEVNLREHWEEPLWERYPRTYKTRKAAEDAACRLEERNLANGGDCSTRIVEVKP